MADLLERDQFLGDLDALLARAAGGGGVTALIAGEAGIGKTSLVTRFAERHRHDARLLWGACEALFTPRPLGPLHDIAGEAHRDLLALLEGGASRSSIFAAFLDDLRPRGQPTVVVIEDAHWADEATLDLIKFLGRRIHRTGALLILTYRDDEVGTAHPLRLVLGDLPGHHTSRLWLPPLSPDAVRALAKGSKRAPHDLHAITGGNPFFVTEVLASGGSGVPTTVRDAVLARAGRLTPAGRATLEAAAIIGTRAEVWLLQAVAGPEGSLEESQVAGMLQPHGDSLVFRHELARQAILDTLLPARTRALHKATLDALRSSGSKDRHLSRLAGHADAASDAEAVLTYAQAAAREAATLGAHREAAAQYARSLRFAGDLDPVQRARLQEDFANEAALIDRLAESVESRQAAIRVYRLVGDRGKEGENLATLATALVRAGRNAEAEEASRQAIELLEALPPGPELGQAYGAQAALRMLNRDSAEAVLWAEKAMAVAEQFGVRSMIVSCDNVIGTALLVAGDERGRAHLERSLAMALAEGLANQAALAHLNLGSALGERFRFREAASCLEAGIAYSRERDLDQVMNYMLAWRALVHLFLGRWNEAAEDAATVVSRSSASAISRIMALVALGRLRARRGDPEVWGALDQALELAAGTQTLQRLAPVRAARAEAAWLRGDATGAGAEAQAAFDLAVRYRHEWFVGELAYWRWRARDLRAIPTNAALPFRLHMEGNWRGAAEAWESIGCPYERAVALGDGEEEAQREALVIFEGLGAGPAAEWVRRSLRSQGARGIPRGPRVATRANPAGLTPREVEVLTLVAEGLQNTEIAKRLFVSPKTVDHHVSSILAKLQVRSRAEASSAAHRLGLVAR